MDNGAMAVMRFFKLVVAIPKTQVLSNYLSHKPVFYKAFTCMVKTFGHGNTVRIPKNDGISVAANSRTTTANSNKIRAFFRS
jgi:hypothetical protein